MRVLVTGGMGFIGGHLVRLLLAERPGWEVWNLDALTYAASPEALADVAPAAEAAGRYRFVRADVADAEAVAGVLGAAPFDAVLNLAAESHVDRSIHGAAPFLHTNVLGAQVQLDAARAAGVRRFVQVSTDEVYGDLGPDDPPAPEGAPLAPSSAYSASKAAADLLALACRRTHGQDVVVTRGSNSYGPWQHPEKLIPRMTVAALRGRELPVYGTGDNVRDWIHVEDHCRGILAALERGRPGGVYNLGGGTALANLEVVRRIVALTGADPGLVRFVADRPGHDRRYAVDAAAAARELGWRPARDFDAGLADTVEWYRRNRGWWEGVCDDVPPHGGRAGRSRGTPGTGAPQP